MYPGVQRSIPRGVCTRVYNGGYTRAGRVHGGYTRVGRLRRHEARLMAILWEN